MRYGIKTVVGGWHESMTDEELIPWTIARTQIEHAQLRQIIKSACPHPIGEAAEFGCGYGRNLYLLRDFASDVSGFERDQELAGLAKKIWDGNRIQVFNQQLFDESNKKKGQFDLVLTFTVLQHIIDDEECFKVCAEIQRSLAPGGSLVICEETDETLFGSVVGRSIGKYRSMLDKCNITNWTYRQVGQSHTSAQYMIFKRGRK